MTSKFFCALAIACAIGVTPATAAQTSRNCKRAVGTWTVTSLGLPWHYDVKLDGTALVDNWNRSTWTCMGNIYTFTNGFGAHVTLTLAADGNHMSGTMTDGMPASAVRTSGPPPLAAESVSRDRRAKSEPRRRRVAAAPSEAQGRWKQFGADTHPNPNGVVVVRCLDTRSVQSVGDNKVTYRYTTQSRNAPCGSGAPVKTDTVDCSRPEAYRFPARNPALRDMLGPVAEANDYACARTQNVAPAKDGAAQSHTSDCGRYLAAIDRCIRSAPNEKIRKAFTDLRGAAVELVDKGDALAQSTCKADLAPMQKCLGLSH